jgi:hypothetical protein
MRGFQSTVAVVIVATLIGLGLAVRGPALAEQAVVIPSPALDDPKV